MARVHIDHLRQRFEEMIRRRRYYEWKSEQPGRLARHEVWRHMYLSRPYMIGADDGRLAQRFKDIFLNVMEVDLGGKLGPVPFTETDVYMETFTHLLEEYGAREGNLPMDLVAEARLPITRYFEYGDPIGFKMFENYEAPVAPVLVKYGRRKYLEPMLRTGILRLANAKSYNSHDLVDAARDNETVRTFIYPTYKERLRGETWASFGGCAVELGDDDFELPLIFGDYYLFSLCERIHHRMAADFSADCAIVIRDPPRFIQSLKVAFDQVRPHWQAMADNVVYYDPYRDYSKFRVPQMAKHFRYGYQKEFRIAFIPNAPILEALEPLFLEIGPMMAYADLVPE